VNVLYNFDQLFKSNLTFSVVLICRLKNQSSGSSPVLCVLNPQFEKSVFLRRVVHSQSTLQPFMFIKVDGSVDGFLLCF
jgi:hypothetical protein